MIEPIDVLMPLKRQRPAFLRDAIGSVLGQTAPDWRLLVLLDPAAPVEVHEVLGEVRDPRVRTISVERPGFAAALNRGLHDSDAPFAALLLSDDRFHPRAIETLHAAIRRRPRADVFHSARRMIDPAGAPVGRVQPAGRLDLAAYRTTGAPVKHLFCWRNATARAVGGFDEELSDHGCDDYDFPWRLAESGARFHPIRECLYEYRIHADGDRLTTGTAIDGQVAILRRMFARHGVGETTTDRYVQRALRGYLVQEQRGPRTDPAPSVRLHLEAGLERLPEFVARGWTPGRFFPHRATVVPKGGPDALKLAWRMLGVNDPGRVRELILHALPPVLDRFPADLWTDRAIYWHGQQLGLPGHVATANLVVDGDRLWAMVLVSDLVQRIPRRRELKTQVESRFRGWARVLVHAVVDWAAEAGFSEVRISSADLALRHTDRRRSPRREMFERIYDRAPRALFDVGRSGEWWTIDLAANRGRRVRLDRRFAVVEHPRTICVHHDVERGLGHADVDPAFAARADGEARRALDAMLAIEEAAGVRATYSVVGRLMAEVRGPIEAGGHTLAFHSWDHHPPGEVPQAERWLRYRWPGGDPPYPLRTPDLEACRSYDDAIRGYRPPRSDLPSWIDDRRLSFHGFEWLASSAESLGLLRPTLVNGIVRIPILFDDHDLHTGATSIAEWEDRARARARIHDVTVFSTHDCYAAAWLPTYRRFLDGLAGIGVFATLDEIAAREALAASTWG